LRTAEVPVIDKNPCYPKKSVVRIELSKEMYCQFNLQVTKALFFTGHWPPTTFPAPPHNTKTIIQKQVDNLMPAARILVLPNSAAILLFGVPIHHEKTRVGPLGAGVFSLFGNTWACANGRKASNH
jgi:hypothetical protein